MVASGSGPGPSSRGGGVSASSALTWLGTRTENYRETTEFFGRVLGVGRSAEEPGLTMFRLPGGEHHFVEVFDVVHPDASVMTRGPVAGFLARR